MTSKVCKLVESLPSATGMLRNLQDKYTWPLLPTHDQVTQENTTLAPQNLIKFNSESEILLLWHCSLKILWQWNQHTTWELSKRRLFFLYHLHLGSIAMWLDGGLLLHRLTLFPRELGLEWQSAAILLPSDLQTKAKSDSVSQPPSPTLMSLSRGLLEVLDIPCPNSICVALIQETYFHQSGQVHISSQ